MVERQLTDRLITFNRWPIKKNFWSCREHGMSWAISYMMKYILESLRVHYEMCIWTHTYPVEIMMQGHLGDIWASKCPVEQKIPFGKHLECVSNGYDASACVRRVIALRPEMLRWNHGGDWITDLGVERLFSSWKFTSAPCSNIICYRVVMLYFLLGGGGNPFIRSKRGNKLIRFKRWPACEFRKCIVTILRILRFRANYGCDSVLMDPTTVAIIIIITILCFSNSSSSSAALNHYKGETGDIPSGAG